MKEMQTHSSHRRPNGCHHRLERIGYVRLTPTHAEDAWRPGDPAF